MKVTAKATRSGAWWAVEVPEVPGVFTQARRLDQVPAMVRDAVSLAKGIDPESIEVAIVPETEADDVIAAARSAKAEAEAASSRASELVRIAAHRLVDHQVTVRDAGELLGVSPQRISQLVKR